ncbi:MAG: hypothetical protein ACJ788_03965 [Ktedonobacteraceae bacterium]
MKKSLDWFILLACIAFGSFSILLGLLLAQPARTIIGVLFLLIGFLVFAAFTFVRKRKE